MDPREETRLPFQPLHRLRDDEVAPFLNRIEKPRVVLADLEAVGVVIETARQTRLAREDDGRDERGRGEPAAPERLCNERNVRREGRGDIVADAVLGRVPAGEHRDVRRACQRDVGGRVRRPRAFAREPVDVRCLDVRRPVDPEAIRAQRIDRDEQDVRRGRRTRRRLRARAARREHDRPDGEEPGEPHRSHEKVQLPPRSRRRPSATCRAASRPRPMRV